MTLLQERHRSLTFLPATPSSWSQTLDRLFEMTIQRLSRARYLASNNGKGTTYLNGTDSVPRYEWRGARTLSRLACGKLDSVFVKTVSHHIPWLWKSDKIELNWQDLLKTGTPTVESTSRGISRQSLGLTSILSQNLPQASPLGKEGGSVKNVITAPTKRATT